MDSDRLLAYVLRYYNRKGCWPEVKRAARSLGWPQSRVGQAVEDHEHLGTQSYFCVPPEPFGEHEIYSTYEGPEL